MAQPKVIENLDKLSQVNFPIGIKYLGNFILTDDELQTSNIYDSLNTFLKVSTEESGIYLIITNVFNQNTSSVLQSVNEIATYAAVTTTANNNIYIIHTILFDNGFETTKEFLDQWFNSTNSSPIKGIQIAEGLGENSKKFYRYYLYERQDNSDSTYTYIEKGWDNNWHKLSTDTSVIDYELKNNSINPVANRVIFNALENKSDANHTHSDYLTSNDIVGKINKTGDTMAGELVAQSNTNYTTYQVRNIALNTSASTPTGNGSILGVYS